MKKKGFTLIELLAVIVILAIIALIATPIVMNVIDNAKKGAAERSAENYLRAVETAVIAARLDGTIVEDGLYTTDDLEDIIGEVEVSGDKPIGGTIEIVNGEVANSIINTSETTLMYDESGKKEFDVWDGTTEEITKSADGYHITNVEQLAWVSEQVASGKTTFTGETLYLDADLDLNNIEWTPIGRSELYFKGIFEGNDHTIMNIKISRPQEEVVENQHLGLFGYAYEATIKDLTLVNVDVIGHSRAGALSGLARASLVSNITVFNADISCVNRCGSVFGMTNGSNDLETKYIQDINTYYSFVEGEIYIGGVIGVNRSTIAQNIYSNNLFVKGNQEVGGVIGHFEVGSVLKNATTYSNVEGTSMVGGVIGVINSATPTTLENIKSYATVTGVDNVGGVIGYTREGTTTFINGYAKANITGTTEVGSIIGGFAEDYSTTLKYSNLISESTLNTEYKPYDNLFGAVNSEKTTIKIVDSN